MPSSSSMSMEKMAELVVAAPSAKRARTEAEAFETCSRAGYFGDQSASMESNATGAPRIVLNDHFGEQRAAASRSLAALGMSEAEVKEQLAGVAGRYEGKSVIVTGGARGIGEGIVRVFFEAGANVLVVDRDEAGAGVLAAELNARKASETTKPDQKPNVVQVQKADVSIIGDLRSVVDTAVKDFGRLDCIVSNAGWHPPHKSIDEFSVDDMQNLFQLNFISVFALCKYALPHLRATRGNIINMSSWVGAFGQAKATTYAATKGAVTSFTKALAIDEAANGVRVNCISPGNVWTPLWKAGADAEADPVAAREAGERVQVLGRMGTILETGRLCLCLAADMTFTTGTDQIMSGGAEIGYGMK